MSLKTAVQPLSRTAPRNWLFGGIARLGLSRRNLCTSRPVIYPSPYPFIAPRALPIRRRHSTMATGDIADKVNDLKVDEVKEVEEESDPVPIIEEWRPIVDAMHKATKDAYAASPAFDPSSPSTFQTYWRDVYTRLRDSILNDKEISHYLTRPPVSKFTVTLFDERHALGCPCCQSYSEPAIVLEKEDGVTKEDLMNAIIDTMYGEALPKVFIEADPMREFDETKQTEEEEEEEEDEDEDLAEGAFTDDSGVLTYTYGWMSSGNNDKGERIAYGSEPDIVLYCCEPHEFEKRTRKADWKDEKEETEEDTKDETKEATAKL